MAIRLNRVDIHKFRCIETDQTVEISPDVTVLVGMNESGKTSMLEAMAKTNCYNNSDFVFDLQNDYPRKKMAYVKRSGINPVAITMHYECDENVLDSICRDVGKLVGSLSFDVDVYYDNSKLFSFQSGAINYEEYIEQIIGKDVDSDIVDEILNITNVSELDSIFEGRFHEEEVQKLKNKCKDKGNFRNIIDSYLFSTYIVSNIPKYMYFDEYYSLPSEVSLSHPDNSKVSYKTAKALLDLACVDQEDLKDNNYEVMRSELEAIQSDISEEILQHWSTNSNLRFVFDIEKKEDGNHRSIIDNILKIRVENTRYGVTLPLDRRSKGFNWFFSFLVWFKKIEMDDDSSFVILLDEPGLNLHAKAQNDLLHYINDELGGKFQVIYTTHSPFMIDSTKLYNVRTIVEKDDGTHVSDSIVERGSDTIFPLQAALGYDIAQNLFISAKNLVVEGVADLIYLETMSDYLKCNGKIGLNEKITIIPIGGADKVTSFISLLSGNKLDVVCLLDTIKSNKLGERINDVIKRLIIEKSHILYYDNFVDAEYADVEDMFDKQDYLNIYNRSMGKELSLDGSEGPIIQQIESKEGKNFNHYIPAHYLAKNIEECNLSENTVHNFEVMFEKINALFQ